MEYGLIKDTTLQSMADGLREKGIVPAVIEYLKEADPQYHKTSNAPSIENPTPITYDTAAFNETTRIRIEEASKLRVEVNVGVIADEANLTGSIGNIELYKQQEAYNGSWFTKSIKTEADAGVYIVEVSARQFYFYVNKYKNTPASFGVSLTIYPLDADGNALLVPVTKINVVTPEAMAEAITNFDMPAAIPEEAFNITGNCSYKFAEGTWDWFVNLYGDKIKTTNITNLLNTFQRSKLERIPFTVNIKDCTNVGAFTSMTNLVETPKVRGTISATGDLSATIDSCSKLRDIEDLFEPEMLDFFREYKCTSAYSGPRAPRVTYNYSLRRLPSWWNKFRMNPESTAFYSYSYCNYIYNFNGCYTLDEVKDLPVLTCNTSAAQTSNMFTTICSNTYRLKAITFETNNGQPIVAKWKTQTIDLTNYTGYCSTGSSILNYNSGITADKEVKDDATYQALKNDPDWFATKIEYSRYNHDSAVETINSLPDTSAYLATAGGTNTIKFKKASGSLTDGGAIENLTAEEIAVAAAKGWTVTLVN